MTPEQSYDLGRPIAAEALDVMSALGLTPTQSFACFLVAMRSATGSGGLSEKNETALASMMIWAAGCLPLVTDQALRDTLERTIVDRAGLAVGPQFADQTSICIAGASALTDDKRKLMICGGVGTLAHLRKSGPERWRDPPECFAAPTFADGSRIVGAFDGVPVAEIKDPPPGLGIFLDGEHVGGVIFSTVPGAEGFRSYHNEGEASIDHRRVDCGD